MHSRSCFTRKSVDSRNSGPLMYFADGLFPQIHGSEMLKIGTFFPNVR